MNPSVLWKKVLQLAGILLALWLFLWLLGPILLPFVLGLAVARLTEPMTRRLSRRLPRWLSAALCVAAFHLLLGGGIWLLCRLVCRETAELARALPELAGTLATPAQQLQQRLLQAARRFPDGVGAALEQSISQFFRTGAGLGDKLYAWVFDFVTNLIRKTPDLLLFLLVFSLSSFLLAVKLPALAQLWTARAPASWQQRTALVLQRLKDTLGVWLRTQAKLTVLVFAILAGGFWLLQVDYPLLFAMGIALLDSLPAVGSGIILIPWALLQFLRGRTACGIGLACLYAASALLRTSLEPRLLGKQVGLDPLLTLLALYAGYRLLGVWGMILFPLAAIFFKQLWNQGKNGTSAN